MTKFIVAVVVFIAAFTAHAQPVSEDSLRLAHSLIDATRSQLFDVDNKALPSVCFPPSPLPVSPDAYSSVSGYTGQWGSTDRFSAKFWRQPCSPGSSETYLYLRITPTMGVPFICSSSMAMVQGGIQYDVKITQTYDGSSFCNDLFVPATFLVGQWSFGPFFDRNGALTLYHEGVYATYQASLPAYTSGIESSSVVEYYHAGFDHYFITANPAEIAALDGGAYGGVWKRTFYEFESYSTPVIASVPVCRFFSAAFAPKSSHFYTADSVECEGVKGNSNWTYEGIAFYVYVPTAGVCPSGTEPVYRIYNDGQGGAPNHRFTTSLTVLNQFVGSKGWVSEGLRFCTPL